MRQRFQVGAAVVGDREGTVVADAVLDVVDGLITWLGPRADAPAASGATTVHDLPGVLLPGLVNTHSHGPMVLFRGQGEGLPLQRWLQEVMWPRESRLTPEDVEVAMTAASAEMLRHGTTTSVEMYFQPERMAAAVRTTGARAVVTSPVIGLPGFGTFDEQLESAARLADRSDAQVEHGFGPHSAYTVPLPVLREAAALCRDRGLLLTTHVAETTVEGAPLLEQHGRSVPALLADHDVLGGRVLAAHCVHLDDDDLRLWKDHDVSVAHCPASNAKLASGVARLRDMLDAGVRVGLGTDGAASHDSLDLFEDARLAAALARLRERDAMALTASEAVWLATGAGADAIDRPDLGQLAVGRRADLVHVDTRDVGFTPVVDPVDLLTHLVWSSGSRRVRDVWVEGRQVVREGASTTVDEEELAASVQERALRLAGAR